MDKVTAGPVTELRRPAEAHVYEKTRRYEVPAGTRCASVVVQVVDRDRVRAELNARHAASLAYMEEFGEIEWDSVEIVYIHTTLDVVCELRVRND